MGKLHDMLEATVEEEVRNASHVFTEVINQNTATVLSEIRQRLNLETTIQLPGNLHELFESLQFTSRSDGKEFSLDQRGDGIKVRHVPIVLAWLAAQANHLSAKGRPKTVTIWGYEEPENNLELRRCFELAREFVDRSNEIQSFVTTHSPAFYSVFRSNTDGYVKLFLVSKEGEPKATVTRSIEEQDLISVDSSMGLMSLLEPHFKEAEKEFERLRNAMEALRDVSKPTIFCEGPSDKELFTEAMELFFPNEFKKVAIHCNSNGAGGYTWVADTLIAWSYSRPTAKAVGVFDKDSGAKLSMSTVNDKRNKKHEKDAATQELEPNEVLKNCYSKGLCIPFALEELLPEDIWDHAEKNGWLEDRKNPLALYGFSNPNKSFTVHLEEIISNTHVRRMALKKIKLFSKESFFSYVRSINKTDKNRILRDIKPTLEKCLRKLELLA